MSKHQSVLSLVRAPARPASQLEFPGAAPGQPQACPICGAMVESKQLGSRTGWTCLVGGYAHYYQSRYAHLEQWFTSGEGNLREPLIQAGNHAA